MSAGNLNPELSRVLNACRRQVLLHVLFRGLAAVVVVVVSSVLAATLLDYLFGMPPLIRAASLGSAVVVTGWAAWKHLVVPLSAAMPEEQLGAAIDLSAPELSESVATLISLQQSGVTSSEAGSEFLRSCLKKQMAGQLQTLSTRNYVNTTQTKTRCGAAALSLVLMLLPVLFWPSGSELLLQRMLNPLIDLATVANLYFEVPHADRVVARGSNVQLTAVPMWRTKRHAERPNDVVLLVTTDDGQHQRLPMMFDEAAHQYVVELNRIAETLHYRVSGGGTTTQQFTMEVVDAPIVSAALMTIVPPGYTGFAVQHLDGVIGQIEVFEGSEIEIQLELNKPVKSAALVWTRRDAVAIPDNGDMHRAFDEITGEEILSFDNKNSDRDAFGPDSSLPHDIDPENQDPNSDQSNDPEPLAMFATAELSADRMSAVVRMTADVGGDFVFELQDDYDLENTAEPERSMSVVVDMPPQLTVTGITDGDRFQPGDILPVDCHAKDDIGLGLLELHFRINESATQIVSATDIEQGALMAEHSFRIVLKDHEVKSGDVVSLRARAIDERPKPSAQQTWSEIIVIHIDERAKPPGARAMEQENKAMVAALRRLEQELSQDQKQIEELKKLASDGWNGKVRGKTQRLSEKEQQQGRVLEQIAKEVANHPLMRNAAKELHQLSGQLKDDVPQGLDAAVEANRQQADEQLNQAERQLSEIRKQLKTQVAEIEKLGQLEVNLAELNRLALEAEQLANDARELQQDRDNPEAEADTAADKREQRLQQRADELNEQRKDLADDLEHLLQEERELLKSAQNSQLEELSRMADAAKDLASQQERVAESLKKATPESDKEPENVSTVDKEKQETAERLVNGLLDRIDELAQAAGEFSNMMQDDPELDDNTRAAMAKAEQQISAASDEATAGRFSEAAESLREAQNSSAHAGSRMESSPDKERQKQLKDLSSELGRTAEMLKQLQGNDSATAAARQMAQKQIADETRRLPEQLEQLNERLKMDALEMAAEGEQTSKAKEVAVEASKSSQQASNELMNGQMKPAEENAQKSAEQLNKLAKLTTAPGDTPPSQNKPSPVPSNVGKSVVDALQDLANASEAMKQKQSSESQGEPTSDAQSSSSDGSGEPKAGQPPSDKGEKSGGEPSGDAGKEGQPSESQSGEKAGQQGQPGSQEGKGQPSGSEAMAAAAEALAEAAKNALPGQEQPGGAESPAAGQSGKGSTAMWDGLLPDKSVAAANSRNWGQQNEELDSETADGVHVTHDSEYQALIRMYFREVAKAAADAERKK